MIAAIVLPTDPKNGATQMKNRIALCLISVLLVGILGRWSLAETIQGSATQASNAQRMTVWSRVYTENQAAEGSSIIDKACVQCHGPQLEGGEGPPLKGDRFMENWREDNLGSLFTKIKSTMPRRSSRTLTDDETLYLVAQIMRENGFPAGTEALKVDTLSAIKIERENGPQPLPNRSILQVVGCLTKVDEKTWSLSMAGFPTRLRIAEESTPEELKAAAGSSLGTLTFRLQNLLMLGAFKPEEHLGHKMNAKGTLMRQANGVDSISVTQLEMLGQSCGS